MVAVISVDACPFLAFLDLTCHLQDTPRDQEASPSVGKNSSYFQWCGYFRGPWVSFVTTDEFSVRVTKITSRIGVS